MNLYSITVDLEDQEHSEFVEAASIIEAIDSLCTVLSIDLDQIIEITLVAKGGVIRQVTNASN